jgi:DnaJ homolog subfamily C member 19
MILILWILGIVIVALLVRLLLVKAPTHGKPFLLRAGVVAILLLAIGLGLSGLWPVAMSLLGGLVVYGRPLMRAFGIWQMIKRFRPKIKDSSDGGRSSSNASLMDKPQARQILEVGDNASHEEILSAHKRLMAKNHPDKGGSTYIASQINQAKDILLKD